MSLTFLKLGGSLITDKSVAEAARPKTLTRIAGEIKRAVDQNPDVSLVIGHGSGSFGHTVARRYNTQLGVRSLEEWRGFAEVAVVAARLNSMVLEVLYSSGVPIFRAQPSASAYCNDGIISEMAVTPIQAALREGLVPLVNGDVAFDAVRGGTIISTEEVFTFLAERLSPQRILLAGDYEGVYDTNLALVPEIRRTSLPGLGNALRGSAHADVTGGMFAKVHSMVNLCEKISGLTVRIFSGDAPGSIERILIDPDYAPGTLISA